MRMTYETLQIRGLARHKLQHLGKMNRTEGGESVLIKGTNIRMVVPAGILEMGR